MHNTKHLISCLLFAGLTALNITAANALMADGPEPFAGGSQDGLYAWRNADGSWSIKLSGGGSHLTFDGQLSSTRPINWVNRTGINAHDAAVKSDANTLALDLQVWDLGYDTVTLSVPAGSGLCLRGKLSSASVAHLGSNAKAVALPVDLTQSGACGSSSTTTAGTVQTTATSSTTSTKTSTTSYSGKRRYHPGHYITVTAWDTHADMMDAIKPGVAGIQKRYDWRSLEPTQGNYDFSQIASDLNFVAGQGLQYVVLIEDKTFNRQVPTPNYLSSYTLHNKAGGYTVERWNATVVARMQALLTAMAARFDGNPNFEGVAIAESALSLDDATLNANGYTPERYRDALIQVLKTAASAFSHSQVFWYMNFLTGQQDYLSDIAKTAAPLGVAMGGPDILPDDASLELHTYPLYKDFQGKMPLFNSAQMDSYKHLHANKSAATKYWTMTELYRFGRDNLHLNYIFWHRKTRRTPSDSYMWTDALPVIERNPTVNP